MSPTFGQSYSSQSVTQDALAVADALIQEFNEKRPTVEGLALDLGWSEARVVAALVSLAEVGLRRAADLLGATREIPMRASTFVGAYSTAVWHHT